MEIALKGRRQTVKAVAGVPVMIREIYQNYHLPMRPQELSLNDIKFWYEPLIPGLIKMQNVKD